MIANLVERKIFMEYRTINYGASNAIAHIFKFNLTTDQLTPRLAVAVGDSREPLEDLARYNPYDTETVLAINGGFFKYLSLGVEPIKNCYQNGVKKNTDSVSHFDGVSDIFYINNNLLIQDSGEVEAADAVWLRSGGYNLVKDGSIATTGISAGEYSERAAKTMIGVNGKNVIVAVAEAPGLIGSEMSNLMLSEGAVHAVGLDGSGSTGCMYNGEYVVEPTRNITDAIYFTKKLPEDTELNTGLYIQTDKEKLRIRDNPVTGNILYTLPIGCQLRVRFLLPCFQSDGYQWAATEYNGIKGFSQIDTYNCYTLNGINPNLKLSTQYHAAWIRKSVVDGEVVMEVPRGKYVNVLRLLPGFKTDGYQWAVTSYAGVSGYTQIDVKNWHYFQIVG